MHLPSIEDQPDPFDNADYTPPSVVGPLTSAAVIDASRGTADDTTETSHRRELTVLTTSSRRCMRTCRRKYYYRYELGVVPSRESKPLRMGAAIHLGRDAHNKGSSVDDAIVAATAGYGELPAWAATTEAVEEWWLEREIVARLLSGYFWRWSEVDKDIRVVDSEESFSLPIINPESGRATPNFVNRGKTDTVVILNDGRKAIWETKTTSKSIDQDSTYWRHLRIDEQVSSYYYARRVKHPDIQTCIYDVIRKPEINRRQIPLLDADGNKIVLDSAGRRVMLKTGKPRQAGSKEDGWVLQTRLESIEEFGERLTADIAERPEFYFARREIPRIAADLQEFEQELWDQMKTIAEARRTGRWFRNDAACENPYPCEYAGPCHYGLITADGPLPEGFVHADNLHPELDA